MPPVIKVSTQVGFGVEELADAIQEHYAHLDRDEMKRNRLNIAQQELLELLRTRWESSVLAPLRETSTWNALSDEVAEKKMDPWSAVNQLWETACNLTNTGGVPL